MGGTEVKGNWEAIVYLCFFWFLTQKLFTKFFNVSSEKLESDKPNCLLFAKHV